MQKKMLAAVYRGRGSLALEERPVPCLLDARDALVRVTRCAICTSDLHILNGAVPRARPGIVLGHEFTGEIVELGKGVRSFRAGDRVAANCITWCGECWYCRRGYINNCSRGGWELGCRIDGCQAEYVRVPMADTSLNRIPQGVSDENALFVGDILSSGYFGAQLCAIQPGDCVAVVGAGSVGLCSALCARLFGAAKVVMLDIDASRLQFARAQGLADVTVNPATENAREAVCAVSHGRGADGVIEAAGGADSFQTAWKIARANAVVAVVAMYERAQALPLHEMYGKNLIFKTGGVDAVHCDELLSLLAAKRLDTDFLITHRGPLENILEGYHTFGSRSGGCVKWVVTPREAGALPEMATPQEADKGGQADGREI